MAKIFMILVALFTRLDNIVVASCVVFPVLLSFSLFQVMMSRLGAQRIGMEGMEKEVAARVSKTNWNMTIWGVREVLSGVPEVPELQSLPRHTNTLYIHGRFLPHNRSGFMTFSPIRQAGGGLPVLGQG